MALEPIGPAFQVDNGSGQFEREPPVAALEGGGYVVVWATDTDDVVYQLLDSAGNEVGPERIIDANVPGSNVTTVTGLEGGGFVIAWQSFEFPDEVRGQVFDADGEPLGDEFVLAEPSEDFEHYSDPDVTALAGGGFVVTFLHVHEPGEDKDAEVRAQVFDDTGAKVGAEFQVNTLEAGLQWNPSTTALAGGGFVAVYHSAGEIRAQIFDDAGAKVGGEFQVNTVLTDQQWHPDVAALTGGGFVVTWVQVPPDQVDEEQDGQVRAQAFDASGAKVGPQISVEAGGGLELRPAVSGLPDGGFVLGWTEYDAPDDVFPPTTTSWLQTFSAQGGATGAPVAIDSPAGGRQWGVELTTLENGDVVASWRQAAFVFNDPDEGVHNQIFDFTVDPVGLDLEGDSGANTLIGGDFADTIAGNGGADSVLGGNGGDQIKGGSGHDTLFGGEGADTIEGKSDNDSVVGGNGDDRLEGESGRDTLSGGDGNDDISGGSGVDRLIGGLGNDTLDGDSSRDVFVFGPEANPGERDLIVDFRRDDENDRIELLGGVTIVDVDDSDDVTGDGDEDTVLTLSNGGTVVLSDFTNWNPGMLV